MKRKEPESGTMFYCSKGAVLVPPGRTGEAFRDREIKCYYNCNNGDCDFRTRLKMSYLERLSRNNHSEG